VENQLERPLKRLPRTGNGPVPLRWPPTSSDPKGLLSGESEKSKPFQP
jgi:hypothetical protein